jgi:hypothetical protein
MRPERIEERWRECHERILGLAERVKPSQMMHIRGEWLVSEPDLYLPQICEWLNISSAPAAIEAMKHPENSPYACMGPPNAPYGSNPGYVEDPRLRVAPAPHFALDGPLEWVPGSQGFSDRTIELARLLGYC